MHRTANIALLMLVSSGCLGGSPGLEPLPAGGRHVLFVGNSLTYTNDLPATLVAIAESAGDTIRVATEAAPNLALIDHLNGGTRALPRIAQGGWHLVVLQQGPTPPGICRDSLILWTKMFDPHIAAVGARPAVFMSWPYQGPLTWFDDIEASFELAAKSVDGSTSASLGATHVRCRCARLRTGCRSLSPSPQFDSCRRPRMMRAWDNR